MTIQKRGTAIRKLRPKQPEAAARAEGPKRAARPAGAAKPAKPAGAAKPLHLQAYELIKHQIITLGLRPGEYVNEAQISAALGIGRTPIHQALNRLTLEGMVEMIPRKGVIVRGISLNDVIDIIDVRLLNETYCARLAAARADEHDIRRMTGILDEAEEIMSSADVERQMMLDREFHLALSSAAGNQALANIMATLHDQSLRFWFISLREREHHAAVNHEHRAILDAIVRHDPDAADRAVRAHIESFRKNVSRLL